jgi:hypothetical protein
VHLERVRERREEREWREREMREEKEEREKNVIQVRDGMEMVARI